MYSFALNAIIRVQLLLLNTRNRNGFLRRWKPDLKQIVPKCDRIKCGSHPNAYLNENLYIYFRTPSTYYLNIITFERNFITEQMMDD